MKNNKHLPFFFVLLSLLFMLIVSCSHDAKAVNEKVSKNTGTATVKMYVPDYYAIADGAERAIAPHTEYAKLSYYDVEMSAWVMVNKIALADAEKTEIENEEIQFPGYIYTFSFNKVYAQTYSIGTLKIDLLDSNENVITSGTNSQEVVVSTEDRASGTFYTIPQDLTQSESYLNKGQMKFYRYTFKAGCKYFIHNKVAQGNNYPDLVFFNNNGTLDDYFIVDSEEDSIIEIPPYEEDSTKIIGIWADDNTYVSRYTISIYPELLGIYISDVSIDLCKDETYQIDVKTIPEGAYLGNLTYSSDCESIVVNESGVVSTSSTDDEVLAATITVTYEEFTTSFAVNYRKGTNLFGTLTEDDLHWTKEGSPYRIKGDILVKENTTLVIDSGVTVRFTGSYGITVNGGIQAVGTDSEPITFTGKNGTSYVQWSGISVGGSSVTIENKYNYVSGNILEHCNFDTSSTPVTINAGIFVSNCTFENGGYPNVTYPSVIINNEFKDGLDVELNSDTSGEIIVENNKISSYFRIYHYRYGAASIIKHNDFDKCIFHLDSYLYSKARDSISYNNFTESSVLIGYNSDNSKKPMTYNNFIRCSTPIVSTDSYYCSNSSYDFSYNYWGEENTAELNRIGNFENASFINDYFDNSERSRVDYSNWLTSPVEKCGYLGDGFVGYDVVLAAENGMNPDSYSPYILVNTNVSYSKNAITKMRCAKSQDALLSAEWQDYVASYQYDIDLSDVVTATIPVYVQLKDEKGNESFVFNSSVNCFGDKYVDFTFKVNNSDADYSNFKETSNPVVTIKINPEYNFYNIEKYRIGQVAYSGATTNYEAAIENFEWVDYTDTFEFTINETALYDGYAYIIVQLKDEKGSISSSRLHVIPFGAPTITCTTENNATYDDSVDSVTYEFTMKDGGKIKKYQIYVDSALVQSNSYGWIESLSVTNSMKLKYMAAGNHKITVKVWDEAKNISVKEIPFVITHANAVDVSELAGIAWDTSTGQPLKDDRTTYLWHLDTGGTEVDDSSAGISDFRSACQKYADHYIDVQREGFKRSLARSAELGLYRQSWCGCEFSKGKK